MDRIAGGATGPPTNRPAAAPGREVIGLTLTNAGSQPGIVCVGTSTLLPKVSGKYSSEPKYCTPCGVLTSRPISADSQHSARANASTSRHPAAADSGLVVMRKPSATPNPSVIATEIM